MSSINKNTKTIGYKVNNKEILALLHDFYRATLNLDHKSLAKEILDSKTISSDNASLIILLLKRMLDEDIYRTEYQGCPEIEAKIQKLYDFLSEYFYVYLIDDDIGYMCYDQKAGFCTFYMNDGEVA